MPESKKQKTIWHILLRSQAKILLTLFILVAALFIFDHLNARSLWLDEALVANSLRVPLFKLHTQIVYGNHPIFYLYAVKLWSLFFGESEIALRGFSALFALLLIILMYFSGQEIFPPKSSKLPGFGAGRPKEVLRSLPFGFGKSFLGKRATGVWAALLASTSYFLIWFGTQLRPYTFAAFWTLLSFTFFIKLLRQFNLRNAVLYILFTALSLYTHPWTFLVFASQIGTTFFWLRGKRLLRNLLIHLIVFILAIPNLWVVFLLAQKGVTSWMATPGLGVFYESFNYLTYGSFWVYLGIALLSGFYLFQAKEATRPGKNEKLVRLSLGLYLVLPLVLAWIVSQFRPAYATGRYEFIVLPALLLLLARLYSAINSHWLVAACALLLIGSCYHSVIKDRQEAASYLLNDRILADELLGKVKKEDTVVVTDLSWATLEYYLKKDEVKLEFEFLSFPEEMSREHPGWKDIKMIREHKDLYGQEAEILAAKLKEKKGSIWVLYKGENPASELLLEKLSAQFALVSRQELPYPRQQMWLDEILVFQ